MVAEKLNQQQGHVPKIHLACGAAMGFACIFRYAYNIHPIVIDLWCTRNVLVKYLNDINHLEQSERYDGVMGITAIDIDFDGRMEICVSTYGHQLLIYRETLESSTPHSVVC